MTDVTPDRECLCAATTQDRASMGRDRVFPRPVAELRKLMQDEGHLRKRLRTEVARSNARTEMLLDELVEAIARRRGQEMEV